MLSRRIFSGCALCAITSTTGLISDASAQTAPAGVVRKVLNTVDMPGGKLVCIQMVVDVEPNFKFPRHTHPGIESSYVQEGSLTLITAGLPDRVLNPGDGFEMPAETPHAGVNGPTKARLITTYTVEKDKPLATLAPA